VASNSVTALKSCMKMGQKGERKTDRAWVSREKGQYSKEDVGKGNTVLVVPNVQKTKQKSVHERDLPLSSVKMLNL